MSLSSLFLCLLAAVWSAAPPSTLRGLTHGLDGRGQIVGGEPVEISQFPWQVSLEEYENGKLQHFCGGSIIGSTWVLTAASCLLIYTAKELHVRAGSSFRASGGHVFRVATIIRHEHYDRSRDYDFALLKISEPISFGSNVQAVILGSGEIAAGTEVTATGWGFTGVGKPKQLHAVTTTIVDRDACRAAYSDLRQNITERMICAGVEGGMGPCAEDGGGPLVAGNTQYGVVSFGVGCATPGYPSVYSNVPAVRSWITERTGI